MFVPFSTIFTWKSSPNFCRMSLKKGLRIDCLWLPSLKLTVCPWKSPCFLVNTIKMVDFPWRTVSFREGMFLLCHMVLDFDSLIFVMCFNKVCSFEWWHLVVVWWETLLRDGIPKHPYPSVETKIWCKKKALSEWEFHRPSWLGRLSCVVDWPCWGMEMFTSYHCPSVLYICRQCIIYIYCIFLLVPVCKWFVHMI